MDPYRGKAGIEHGVQRGWVVRAPLPFLSIAVAAVAACGRHTSTIPAEPLKVAAAADLAFAFKDVGEAYEKSTGHKVVFSFGSTGLLEKQIAEGAPFDVFAAANVSFADDAVSAGACLADSKSLYATGRVVLYTPKDAVFHPTVVTDLTDARIAKIAIANPEHAPYGKAARQAMERAGVWEKVKAKVVYGENVQQTLQFAQSGNADVAIVAMSLATVTPGDWTVIPGELHDRIDQALVVCTHGKAGVEAGRRFTAFVSSADGREVMRRYGFLLPNEAMTAEP
jgi:molybdate transport system substrate-binding protein